MFDPVFAVIVLNLVFDYRCNVQHFTLRSPRLGPGSSFVGNTWVYVHMYPVLSGVVCRCSLNWSTFFSEFFNIFFVLSGGSFASLVSLLAWCCPGRCSFIWFKWVLSIMAGVATSSGTSFLARFGFVSSCPCLFIARPVYSGFWLALKKTWVGPILPSFGTPLAPISPIS